MTRPLLLSTAAFCLLACSSGISATFYVVPATANIFAAGEGTAPAGTLPPSIGISPGEGGYQFQSSGTVSPFYFLYNLGAEGLADQPTLINSLGGISGYEADHGFPLVGVFLAGATPTLPAPPTLNFSSGGLGRNFAVLSPELGQIFFIGDGVTDDGLVQTFYAPAGATALYLGFPDAPDFQGDPSNYFDNTGSLSVGVTAVPEPAAVALLGFGTCLLALRQWARRMDI